MDWKIAARYTLLWVAIAVGVILAVFVFSATWARVGLWVAVALLVVGFYLVKKWDDRRAVRDRERLESGR